MPAAGQRPRVRETLRAGQQLGPEPGVAAPAPACLAKPETQGEPRRVQLRLRTSELGLYLLQSFLLLADGCSLERGLLLELREGAVGDDGLETLVVRGWLVRVGRGP